MNAGRNAGFTFLSLLLIVAMTGAVLAAAGAIWSQAAQRDRERELLFVGDQFRQAIALYYWRTPGGLVHEYPKSLEALLEDKRYPMPQRYLRRIYRDPVTGGTDWGIVNAPGDAGIMGVYSKSTEMPLKSGNFPQRWTSFEMAQSYADWKFVFSPETPGAAAQQAAGGPK